MRVKKSIYIIIMTMLLIVLCAFSFNKNTGDSITIFSNKVIAAGDVVTGDAVVVFGNLEIRGAVTGDVVAVFGNVDLYGEAKGDVVAVFGNVDLYKNAVVGGDAVGVFGNVNKEEGAVIKGDEVDTKGEFTPKNFSFVPNMSFGAIFGIAIMYGLACLLVAIIPERIAPMVYSSRYDIWRHLSIGILVLLILILLIPILVITIIGIIPAVLLLLGFILVALMSSTAVYIALGQKIASAVEGKNAIYIQLLIGVVVVNALTMIPLLGALASMAVFFVGLGVAFETRVGGLLGKKKAL